MLIPAVAFAAALLVMMPAVCGDEALATHKHDGDSKAGHPSIPPTDYNGNHYDIYLERETRQLVFYIDMHTDNLDTGRSYVIGFVNGGPAYVRLGGYDYVTSTDGNWTKYGLTLTSDNMRKIEGLYAAKGDGPSLKFGLAPGAVFYYDEDYGYVDSRNVQHSLELVDVLDRKPRFVSGGGAVELEQGDAYPDAGIACVDNDDLNPILSHNASTAHAGHFVVEHTCADSSGNEAVPVYRMLYVSAKKPPAVAAPPAPLRTAEGTELIYYIKSDSQDAEFSLVSHNASHRAGPAPTVTAEGRLSWIPSEAQGGHGDVYRITIEAIDARGASSPPTDILVEVAESNSAPTMRPFEGLDAPHGAEISIDVSANAADPDVPRNALVYSMSGAGSIDAATGVYTWTPRESEAGVYLVNFTVSDGRGEAAATQAITVRDVTPPVIGAVSGIEARGDLPLEVWYSPPAAVDLVDGPVPVTCTPASGTPFAQAVTTVTCNARDAAGNHAAPATFDVVVAPAPDTEAPAIVPAAVGAAEATGPTTAVSVPLPAVSDNHDGAGQITIRTNVTGAHTVVTSAVSHAFAVGTHTVHWSATDTSGNVANATQTVTVRDTTPPAIVPAAVGAAEATGPTTAVSVPLPAVSDNHDGAGQITIRTNVTGAHTVVTSAVSHAFAVGTHTVHWSATDTSGNVANATQTVTVRDTTPPAIVPAAVGAAEATGPTTAVSVPLPAVSDNHDGAGQITIRTNVTGAHTVVTSAVSHAFAVGTHTVHWSATDTSGNVANATQTVTVRDTTPPAIVPAAVGAAEATGPTTAVSVPLPAVSDNHDGAGQITIRTNVTGAHTVVTSAVSHAFAVGTHTVHWSATDTSGNVANATQTVTVRDTTPPAIVPAAVGAAEATGPTTAVSVPLPAVSDNHDGAGQITIRTNVTGAHTVVTSAVSHAFAVGTHTVHWSATDTSGNVANATQTVTVRDTTPPAIVPAAVGAAEATGPTTAVSVPLPAVSDNHDGAGQITIRTNVTGAHTVVTSAVSHAFAVGTHTVHWSATDTSGNVANATQTVTVRDTTPPAWYANRPQSPDAEASPAAAVNALDAERKQLHETFKELKKDIKRMRASVGEALDGIAGSDKRYAKQQKEIASLEKALDKARAEKRLKKDLLEFYVNPERVFRDHGADGRTGNHVLAFLPGHAPGCDGAAPGGPCISPSIHAGRDKSRPMALGDIRDLGFWPNRTVHSGDTFEWTYPAGVEMGAVTVTAPDGSRAEASPGHHDPPINGTSQSLHGPGSQSHTFDAPGVFRWYVEGHPATSGIITVVEAPPLRSLLGGAGADATGAQNAEQSGIAILERKIALWNEKIDALRDVEKDLRKILKSARSGGLDLGDLHLMSLAEINDLSKAAKDVKKRTIRLDDVLRYHAQPGHVFSDHGRNEETGNHVIELSRDCGGDENGYCLSPDVFKQMRDGKRPALTKIGHLGLWPDRSIWSGETVEWSYHGAGTHGGGMAQETITITAPDGTKSKTSPGSPGGAGGKAAPQIHTFADAGRYAWLLDGNPNVNGTISVERAK